MVTVHNRTDSVICYSADGGGGCSTNPVKPHAEARWGSDCYGDDQPMAVVLATAEGDVFYTRESTCGAWKDSGATIIIERSGEEFVVRDNLPED
jgi:hypothetical protein